MGEVVDLVKRVTEAAAVGPANDGMDSSVTQVRLIACSQCDNATFNLTHEKRVVCAKCHILVEPLRWWDVNTP